MELIRPRMSHAPALAEAKNDYLVTRYLGPIVLPYTMDQALADIALAVSEEDSGRLTRVIAVDGEPVGWIYGRLPRGGQNSAELGYWLGRAWWGRGIMTAAAGEMCRLLFARGDVHRVWASALAVNVGSWRVMEKIGMRREGVFREAVTIDGAYYDDLYYAVLRQEFLP